MSHKSHSYILVTLVTLVTYPFICQRQEECSATSVTSVPSASSGRDEHHPAIGYRKLDMPGGERVLPRGVTVGALAMAFFA